MDRELRAVSSIIFISSSSSSSALSSDVDEDAGVDFLAGGADERVVDVSVAPSGPTKQVEKAARWKGRDNDDDAAGDESGLPPRDRAKCFAKLLNPRATPTEVVAEAMIAIDTAGRMGFIWGRLLLMSRFILRHCPSFLFLLVGRRFWFLGSGGGRNEL